MVSRSLPAARCWGKKFTTEYDSNIHATANFTHESTSQMRSGRAQFSRSLVAVSCKPVSYTHLDVYKRQTLHSIHDNLLPTPV